MKTCPAFSTGPNAIVKASQGCVLCFCDSHCFHRCCAWHHHKDKSRMHVMLSRASSLSYSLGPRTISRWSSPFWWLILLGRPCTSLTGLSCLACQDIPDTEALERWFVCFFLIYCFACFTSFQTSDKGHLYKTHAHLVCPTWNRRLLQMFILLVLAVLRCNGCKKRLGCHAV